MGIFYIGAGQRRANDNIVPYYMDIPHKTDIESLAMQLYLVLKCNVPYLNY